MSEFKRGEDGIYRCSAFDEFGWLRHGFGTRAANPPFRVTLRQIHSNVVLNARPLQDRECEGDALVTDEIGRAIGVRTADCVPILVLDPNKRAVAAVHAGWRGTSAQIIARTINLLREEFNSVPGELLVAIGPCVRQCCYEVSLDVSQHFYHSFAIQGDDAGKRKLDLAAANRCQMVDSGIQPDRIFDMGECTVCRAGDFFSYRREPENPGRMISSIERLA